MESPPDTSLFTNRNPKGHDFSRANKDATSLPKASVKAQPQRLNCLPSQQHEPYVTNVASTRNGIGYGYWAHIDGWSEAVVEYIRELERSAD